MVVRVDSMSLKGGAGKTTVAFRLARAQSLASKRPVLIVDADFAGACLGDLLEPWVETAWGEVPNLVDLVCDRPETLPEHLADHERFPVYELRPSPSPSLSPARVTRTLNDPCVLFCPSHTQSITAHVSPTLLHALVAHESAGGWVDHAIGAVVQRTIDVVGPLGGVVVDHSPGLSALPWAVLCAVQAEAAKGRKERRALFVTTPDLVDLKAWFAMRSRPETLDLLDAIGANATWVINRLPATKSGQPDTVRARLPEPEKVQTGAWLDKANKLSHDEELAAAYARGGLVQLLAHKDPEIEPLRALLFDGGAA